MNVVRMPKLTKEYKGAVIVSLLLQALDYLMIWSSTIMDVFAFQVLFSSFYYAWAAYLFGCGVTFLRRSSNPSRSDLFYVRYGFVPLHGISLVISKGVLIANGYSSNSV